MSDMKEKFSKAFAAGREAVRNSNSEQDERWRLLPTIVIAVLVAVLWHWLHWYAAILVAVGVGIIVQAITVAIARRGRDVASESKSQEPGSSLRPGSE